ncbi:phage/plasmid primase, P4 family [Sphingomonas nostoxanthinifaciens]|uniref:phage/plasmid primase, P4 family n=1 Tax=Sphingomonas nostoxanthinifaciens TaxID=2872652 RepID=UPI001CC1CB3C|nr:phage/plasmid primase, P4 family [Sphingomonas nostoxanthinifaciens]UAK24361.1 bifunctional DNA primase/polymerase [Sphingomonas nostoxanthinifaciens]
MTPLPSPMCSAALRYARRGWRVFPCRERDDSYVNGKGVLVLLKAKAPYIGTGVKGATTDERQIREWWKKWPKAMIGFAVGDDGLFVVDFDPRHDAETGEEFTLEALKDELELRVGAAVPASLAVRTPSSGVHVYLQQPNDGRQRLRNRVGTKKSRHLPQHVDVRAAGGYVILPPSKCEGGASAAAGEYRWLRGKADEPVVAAPSALLDLLLKRNTESDADDAGPTDAAPARPRARSDAEAAVVEAIERYGLRALQEECRSIRTAGSGARNAQLNESALKVASLTVSKPFAAIDAAMAKAMVQAAARNNPGRDDDSQLLATIESGWSAGLRNARDLAEIAASARSRHDRFADRADGRRERAAGAFPAAAPPAPHSTDNGKPSSQPGSKADAGWKIGAGGGEEDTLTRECAFLPQTDLGNLERFLKRYGEDFTFVEAWGWLAWDGRRWNRDMATAMLGRAVQDTMRAIQDEADLIRDSGIPEEPLELWSEEQKAEHARAQRGKFDRIVMAKRNAVTLFSDTIAKWGRTSEGAGHIKCIGSMAEARLSARPEDFDAAPLLVNLANGTLVFARPDRGRPASVRLVPHNRRDRITKMATAGYDPAAASPAYDAFLARVQPDADMRSFLDAWGGYNMLGDASAQKMAIFYGEGANGKGVWINTKRALLGDYAWAASINTFMSGDRQRRGSEASPDLAALAGRRMVYANEAQEGSKFDDALVKELTSDEPKGGVRELLKPPFELQITFKNTIICNNTPRIGTDHGIRRRIQIVPWGIIIPDEEQDLQLKSKLVEEAAGILNRLVRGALAFLDHGLPMPEAVREATEQYLDENDILGKFLSLCTEKVDGATIGATALHELFAAWQTWAQLLQASGKPWSPKYLAGQLEKKGYRKRKSSSMIWDNLSACYDPQDFIDSAGKPVVRELPAPRRSGASPAPPSIPSDSWAPYDDDIP